MLKQLLNVSFVVLGTSAAIANPVCQNSEGSFVYDSATKVSKSVVVINPGVLVAGKRLGISGFVSHSGEIVDHSGQGICRALGYATGNVSIATMGTKEPNVSLNSSGQIVQLTNSTPAIGTVVCFVNAPTN